MGPTLGGFGSMSGVGGLGGFDWEALKQRASAVVHSTFGEPIRYQTREGQLLNICAAFTMTDAQVSMGGEVAIDTRRPSCSIQRNQLPRRPRQGDLITRRSVTYEVTTVHETLDASYELLLLAVDSRHAVPPRSHT